MAKTISVLCLGVVTLGLSVVVGGCGSDVDGAIIKVSPTTTAGTGGSAGGGGEGGMAGGAGMGGTGGMGMGGMGMGGAGGGATCSKPPNACGACLFDQCNLAYCGCTDEAACGGLIGCIQACPAMDAACAGGCYAKNSAGFAEYVIASSCAGTLCAPSCPGSDQVKPCDLCLSQQCEPQLESCVGEADCMPLIECLQPCMSDMVCQNKCVTMYPKGMPFVQALFNCASTGCSNSCN